MRLTRVRLILAAGLMALAGTTTAAVLVAGPASASSSQVVVVNCGHGQVRPAQYDIGCMASQEYLAQLRWTSWRSVAFGGGVLKVNNCTPSCAKATRSATTHGAIPTCSSAAKCAASCNRRSG